MGGWNINTLQESPHTHVVSTTLREVVLKGELHPIQKLACFVLYLKIINTFFEKIIYASYSKLPKELKNSINI